VPRQTFRQQCHVISALGGYLFFAPYVLPWYPAWVIPTIGLVPRVAAARLLTLQAALLVLVVTAAGSENLNRLPEGLDWK